MTFRKILNGFLLTYCSPMIRGLPKWAQDIEHEVEAKELEQGDVESVNVEEDDFGKLIVADKDIFDPKIFESTDECNGQHSTRECQSVVRVISALKYFAMLRSSKSDTLRKDIFMDFIQSIYGHFLNDSVHLSTAHQQYLEEIHRALYTKYGFKKCELLSCSLSRRHCRIEANDDDAKTVDDPLYAFYRNIFDSMHFYLFHSFETGLRSFSNLEQYEDTELSTAQCFVIEFARKTKMIQNTREKLAEFFQRFESDNNKYLLPTSTKKKEKKTEGMTSRLCNHSYFNRHPLRPHFDGWLIYEVLSF